MNARHFLAGFIAVAVGALVVYVARNTYWEDTVRQVPLRGAAATNPFYAAEKFATELGATTQVRQTLGALTEDTDVLVLSNWHWDLIEGRRRQVVAWVEAGGHVLVDRSLRSDAGFMSWSGIRWKYRIDDAVASEEEEEESADAEWPGFSPMCAPLHEVDRAGTPIPGGRSLSACMLDRHTSLGTERDVAWGYAIEDDSLQAVRVAIGKGHVTVLNALPFGNRDLAELDHGKLFVAATGMHRGDRIVFLTEHEQKSLLALIWLYGAPVVMLGSIALAALLWRGGIRFGPLAAATDSARRSLAEQIRGTGRFAIRLGDGKALQAATVRALQETAQRRIVRYGSLSHQERIAAIAQRTQLDQETLASAINHTGARHAADLARTIALLETARRRLSQ